MLTTINAWINSVFPGRDNTPWSMSSVLNCAIFLLRPGGYYATIIIHINGKTDDNRDFQRFVFYV